MTRAEPKYGWTSSGRDIHGRRGRLTFASEYHRLIAKERREPWVAIAIIAILLGLAGLVYLVA